MKRNAERGMRNAKWRRTAALAVILGAILYPQSSILAQVAKTLNVNPAASPVQVHEAGTPGLPTGAATSSNQTSGAQKTQVVGADAATALRLATINKDLNTVTITTITTVWTPASGKKFRIMGGSISVSAAMSVLLEDNSAGNTIFRTPKLAADTPYNFVIYGGNGRLSATADQVLKATGSAAGAITGTIYGTEE